MTKVIVTGCYGKMGQALMRLLSAGSTLGLSLAAGISRTHRPGVALPNISSDIHTHIQAADVVIDFTCPESTIEFARICKGYNKAFVTGTTGLTPRQSQELEALALDIPIFAAANMSIGVYIVSRLVAQAGSLLNESFDCEILEAHHNQKADAPSGTALMLGKAVAQSRKQELADIMEKPRSHPRTPGSIGFSSIRGGGIVGDHSVIFAGPDEVIQISHHAINRSMFAQGALKAAAWLMNKSPGKVYTMEDLVGSV